MKQVIMAMYDKAAAFYGQPFFTQSRNLGVRAFKDAINGKTDDQICKHPDDFELYFLGEYDSTMGRFSQPDNFPELVARGSDLKE